MGYEEIVSGAKGYYSLADKKIVIQEGMSELQTLKTLVHELSHCMIHDDAGVRIEGVEEQKKTRNTKEVEAEGTAYTVLTYLSPLLGIGDKDLGEYSFGYITGWSSGKEMKELKESKDTIRKTASYIITKIEDNLLEKTSVRDKLRVAESKSDEMKQIKVKSHKKNYSSAISLG